MSDPPPHNRRMNIKIRIRKPKPIWTAACPRRFHFCPKTLQLPEPAVLLPALPSSSKSSKSQHFDALRTRFDTLRHDKKNISEIPDAKSRLAHPFQRLFTFCSRLFTIKKIFPKREKPASTTGPTPLKSGFEASPLTSASNTIDLSRHVVPLFIGSA
jgi:hypothetical protein